MGPFLFTPVTLQKGRRFLFTTSFTVWYEYMTLIWPLMRDTDRMQNGLRRGYSANQLAASRGEKLLDENLPADLRTSHMRHCIDLIRQGLMCSGDITLEVVDPDIDGVHGFGTEHVCVDWEQLTQWTSRQQAHDHDRDLN
ncbi:hypothetical protein CHU98_g1123 [Xylaria longipes]|nr:hypothetical protein CHU98_g1123 [Xylaria longipes]